MKILLTGATGYIGGRLARRFLEAGHEVRCLVRNARKLEGREWASDPRVEVIEAELLDPEGLRGALEGCEVGYWLVHSMLVAGSDYRERDRQLARAFAEAAAEVGLSRIIYLGGLGEAGMGLSEHLSSRREVELVLGSTGVPVTTLRAAMIIGSGSASFEILRHLVERLPVMVTPRWVRTRCQPIAIRDVLRYLVQCLEVPETTGLSLDVGGVDVLRYDQLMRIMARVRGLPPRWIVPVPVLTPKLSSLWIHLVTPIRGDIARPLAEGLRNEVVCADDRAARLMPGPLWTAEEAIVAACAHAERGSTESSWIDAGPVPGDADWSGGDVRQDTFQTEVDADPEECFRAICRVGGGHGWYAADGLWRLRGWLDKCVGGPGLRRGRRNPERVSYGEALDFWRVVRVEEPRRLTLRAEMKLPGVAELEFRVEPLGPGRSRVVQTARFRPKGLAGLLYWYSVLPLHGLVFRGMLRGVRRAAEGGSPSGTEAAVRESTPPGDSTPRPSRSH